MEINIIMEKNKVYIKDIDNKVLAYLTFPDIDENTVKINHTFVDESLRGMGIANKLIKEAIKIIEHENKKIILECSFAISWFEKNSQYNYLLR